MTDLTILFYSANYISDFFMKNVTDQLKKAAGDTPIISVTQKPMDLGTNICLGDIGRSAFNIYKQILIGAKAATTEFVATAEDDVLYPPEHFVHRPEGNTFAYDTNKWSIYTWTKPQRFSFRKDRRTMTSVTARRDAMIKTLEERFAKFPTPESVPFDVFHHYWGEPGRFEDHLGLTHVPSERYLATVPHIVFSTPEALAFGNLGTKKAHGNNISFEVEPWGKVEDVAALYQPR
jgi:hypothetical protein